MPLTDRLRAVAVVAALAAAAAWLVPPGPATAAAVATNEVYPVPASGVFQLTGHGWGHGHGMSQYGAYGAALEGMTAKQIVAFYYPTTTLATQSNRTIRVRLSAATAGVVVQPISGRTLTASTTVANVAPCTLPKALGGKTVKWWRARTEVNATTNKTLMRLRYTVDGSHWLVPTVSGCNAAWSKQMAGSITFADGVTFALVLPGGYVTHYRGKVRAAYTGSGMYPVNVVSLEAYLRSVTPSEMPAAWSSAALQAQAIAARTYASYEMAHPKSAYYDVYDDTRDQAYTGQGNEDSHSDAAVKASAGEVLHDKDGHAAFTQFSSTNGGWTAYGGQTYLPARQDPYDGNPGTRNPYHTWTATLSVSTVNAVYGATIGKLTAMVVTQRDGNGQWHGRVTAMTLRGTRQDLDVTGDDFRYAVGLKSTWWRAATPPSPPRYVRAAYGSGTVTVTWTPPASDGGSPITHYVVTLLPAGTKQVVDASARSASFTGLDPSTDYRASVRAQNALGNGPGVTVTTKVSRWATSTNPAVNATASSQATFGAGKAPAVVLTRNGRFYNEIDAAVLAAGLRAPMLVTWTSSLPRDTRNEITRVLPNGGVVYVVGGTHDVSDDVVSALTTMGYQVTRVAGSSRFATAAAVATTVPSPRWVFETDGTDLATARNAVAVAAKSHGVVLFTHGSTQSWPTRRWLAGHPSIRRIAIGAAAAAADPSAHAVKGSAPYGLAVAVAQRYFGSAIRVAIAAADDLDTSFVAGSYVGRVGGPVLFSAQTALDPATAGLLGTWKSQLTDVRLFYGANHLAYYDVESGVQQLLLA